MLIEALLCLRSEDECEQFLEDLLTSQELISIGQRIKVAEMLSKGHTYDEVARATGASSATISRVNRCLRYGGGGYAHILEHLAESGDKKTDERG